MSMTIGDRVEAARRGENPKVVGRMASGWLVLGDAQFIPGYCVLLSDPVVESLNDVSGSDRAAFLEDMAAAGDALMTITDAFRINYSILGNLDPALHAHLFPRYRSEPEERIAGPIWLYERADRASVPFDPDEHAPLLSRLYVELRRREAMGSPGPHVDPAAGAAGRLMLSERFERGG